MKVGDKVRRVPKHTDYSDYNKKPDNGKPWVIESIDEDGRWLSFIGSSIIWLKEYFTLVEEGPTMVKPITPEEVIAKQQPPDIIIKAINKLLINTPLEEGLIDISVTSIMKMWGTLVSTSEELLDRSAVDPEAIQNCYRAAGWNVSYQVIHPTSPYFYFERADK